MCLLRDEQGDRNQSTRAAENEVVYHDKKNFRVSKIFKIPFFLKKKHFWEGISPFCRATDTPVLDFWWHLDWVSRPEWIPLHVWFDACMQQIPLNHLWCDTCWPLGRQHGNWAVSSTYLYFINLKIFTEYATRRKKICVWIHYFSHCMEFVRNNILVLPFLKFSRICQNGQVIKILVVPKEATCSFQLGVGCDDPLAVVNIVKLHWWSLLSKKLMWHNLAFHNSRLIRQIEQEKIYKRFRELDQGLNQGYLLSSTPVEVKNTGISGLTKINRHPGLFVSFMSEPILQTQWRIQGSGARDARPLSVQILSFSCSFGKTFAKQECIPVGCVPSAAVAQRGVSARWVSAQGVSAQGLSAQDVSVKGGGVSQHALRQTPPLWTEFLTTACENIALRQLHKSKPIWPCTETSCWRQTFKFIHLTCLQYETYLARSFEKKSV